MKIINAVKFIFPGISENERTARAVVSAFLVQLDPTVEELADIRTAVSEAVTKKLSTWSMKPVLERECK